MVNNILPKGDILQKRDRLQGLPKSDEVRNWDTLYSREDASEAFGDESEDDSGESDEEEQYQPDPFDLWLLAIIVSNGG